MKIATKPKRPISMSRRLTIVLVSALAALFAVECAARVRQYHRYGTFDRLAELVTHESGLRMPVPNSSRKGVQIDSLGFRSPELDTPKPAGRVRVAFLGGSTTFCAEVSRVDAAWPNVAIATIRASFPELDLDFLNASVVGFTVESSERNLDERVKQHDPDIVVILHATNDVGKHARRLAAAQGLWQEDDDQESWLERVSLVWRLMVRNVQIQSRGRELGDSGVLKFRVEDLSAPFRAALTSLVRKAKTVATHVVLVEFEPRVRREQTPAERLAACRSSLFYAPFLTPDSLLDAFDAFNAVIREVGKAEGVLVVPIEPRIPADDEHYNDSVHLLDRGCKILGERVAQAMLAAPDFASLWKR